MKTVEVASVRDFLNSVSSNTEIVIKKGYYNLSDYFETLNDSIIRDCSSGPMNIIEAEGVFEFTNCTLKDSDSFGCFEKTDDCALTFRNCTFGYWETSYFMFLEDITTENCTWSEDYIYPEYGY